MVKKITTAHAHQGHGHRRATVVHARHAPAAQDADDALGVADAFVIGQPGPPHGRIKFQPILHHQTGHVRGKFEGGAQSQVHFTAVVNGAGRQIHVARIRSGHFDESRFQGHGQGAIRKSVPGAVLCPAQSLFQAQGLIRHLGRGGHRHKAGQGEGHAHDLADGPELDRIERTDPNDQRSIAAKAALVLPGQNVMTCHPASI